MNSERAAASRRGRVAFAAIALVAIAAALGGWWWRQQRAPREAATPRHDFTTTLAVLPLRFEGDGEPDRVLIDGLGDELVDALAQQLPALRVSGTTSTRIAAEQGGDLATIGRQLGVDHALDVTLRNGAPLQLSLRLVRIADGQVRWTQEFQRHLGEFPALESEIAHAVAQALGLQAPAPRAAPERVSADHFHRLLQGRNLLREGLPRAADAVAHFRSLVAAAPQDARAHEGLADALYDRGFGNYEDLRAQRDEAAVEARRALELDPALGDPHAVLADAPCRAMQWKECLGELRRAIELAPAATHWRNLYAWRLATLGYLGQARDELAAALAADPFDTRTHYMMATVLDALGDHAAALEHVERQTAGGQNITRWFNAVWRHDYAAALTMAETYGQERWRPCMIAVTKAMQDPALWPGARAAVEASMRPDGRWTFYAMLLPDADVASNILGFENTLRSGNSAVTNYLWAPELANHRRGAEFQAYVRRNHLLDYWREHGWPDRCKADGEGARCE